MSNNTETNMCVPDGSLAEVFSGITSPADPAPRYSEFPPLVNPLERQIKVNFEKHDMSRSPGAYSRLQSISNNIKIRRKHGQVVEMACHSNIEGSISTPNGRHVKVMRYFRNWEIRPLKHAVVTNLTSWRIVGLDQASLSLFSPFPLKHEPPNNLPFREDMHRGGQLEDAPGFIQSGKPSAFGQLNEFIVGNPQLGGAYYQIYNLYDGSYCRVVDSVPILLDVPEYRRILHSIENEHGFLKTHGRKLLFDPLPWKIDINGGPVPSR